MSAPPCRSTCVLGDTGLVAIRRAGRSRFYKLDPAPLRDVVAWADAFAAYFSARLDDLGAYLDRTDRTAGVTGKPERKRRRER